MAKRRKKIRINSFLSIFYILSALYLIRAILYFNKIENKTRYIVVGVIGISILIFLFLTFIKKGGKKKKGLTISLIFLLIFNIYVGYNLSSIYEHISNLNKKVVYSVTMVTLKENENKYNDFSNLKKKKIGLLNKEVDIEIYNLSVLSINNNNLNNNTIIDTYEGEFTMIKDLLDKKIDVAYLPTNYKEALNPELFGGEEATKKEFDKLVSINKAQVEKEVSKEDEKLSSKQIDINKPFTMLLMGIDSTTDSIAKTNSTNGDSLMVVTFNPKTMNMTILSLPRDSYVYITCMGTENKLTHSAQRGMKCVISTIEGFLNVKIDYYVKINFNGVVKLVDQVGGIEVDVPYNVCEQDSKRRFGKYMVYIDKGLQKLNGEQALALSRNRKIHYEYCKGKYTEGYRDDFTRGHNQQLVVMGLLDKIKEYTNVNNFKNLLKIVENNIDTNMSQDTIFSFYDLFKEIMKNSSGEQIFNIQRLVLKGNSQIIFDERSKLEMDNIILNPNSLKAVKEAMKANLGKASITPNKTFSYKYGENYIKNIIGNITYGQKYYTLLPSFIGKTEGEVSTYCKNNGLTLNVEYVVSSGKKSGTVLEQNYPEKKRADLITDKILKIKVVRNEVDCLTSTDKVCNLPDFEGKKISDYNAWKNKIYNKITYKTVEVESEKTEGTIISQSVSAGTTVKEILEANKIITFEIAKKKTIEEPTP